MNTETTTETTTLDRDGKPPLRFKGTLVAKADNHSYQGDRQTRWTELKLFKTAGGKYVINRVRRTCWSGESDRSAADALTTAAEVMEWLREDNDGELGSVSQELLDKAVKVDPNFAAAYVEEVE